MNDRKFIPALLASPEPFRLIKRSKTDPWEPSIEQINCSTYDYVKLHRFSSTIDIGLAEQHTLGISFDGSFILPAIKSFRDINTAVDRFNDVFGRIILGGIFVQAIDATHIQKCAVYENHYFRTFDVANNAFVDLKNSLRSGLASPKDNIILYKANTILASDLHKAYEKGSKLFSEIPNLTPSILAKGISSFINNSFAESLTYNWVSIEQIVDTIWTMEVVDKKPDGKINGRDEFLSDTRSWTASTRLELLFQKNLIDSDLYNDLTIVRKARNKFIHTGQTPSKESSTKAYNSLFELISLVTSQYQDKYQLSELCESFTKLDQISRTFYESLPISERRVEFWYSKSLPSLPGDKDWEQTSYTYTTGISD